MDTGPGAWARFFPQCPGSSRLPRRTLVKRLSVGSPFRPCPASSSMMVSRSLNLTWFTAGGVRGRLPSSPSSSSSSLSSR